MKYYTVLFCLTVLLENQREVLQFRVLPIEGQGAVCCPLSKFSLESHSLVGKSGLHDGVVGLVRGWFGELLVF